MSKRIGQQPPAKPVVRRIRADDAARMRALRLEMLADAPLAFLETIAEAAARPHAEFQARVASNAAGDHCAQFVAEAGGVLIAHAGGIAVPGKPDTTLVFAVYVTPTHRGTGVLARLVEAVSAWSRAAGRDQLLIEVVTGNERALRAYRQLGFQHTGRRTAHPRIPELTELQLRRPA